MVLTERETFLEFLSLMLYRSPFWLRINCLMKAKSMEQAWMEKGL